MKQFKVPKLEKKRAVREDLKDLRRESILDAAEFLLSKQSIESIAMMDVAKTIKLAKGTLYLYFKTKEELFLSLLERAYLRWFEEIETWAISQEKITSNSFAQRILESFQGKPSLLLLVPYAESIFEKNISLDRIIDHKRNITRKLTQVSQQIGQKMDNVPKEKIALSFLFIHAAVVGLYFKSFPTGIVAEALKQLDLYQWKLDFNTSLQIMLEGVFSKLFIE